MGLLSKAAEHKGKSKHEAPKRSHPAASAQPDADQDQGDQGQQGDAGEDDQPQDQDSSVGQPSAVVQPDADAQSGAGDDEGGGDQDEADGQGAQGGSPDDSNEDVQPSADPETGQQTPPGGDQATGQPGSPADDSGGGPAQGVDLSQIPLSPALKEEYQRANAALYTALYKNDQVAQAIIRGIQPSGPHKVESVVHSAVLLVTQINKQLHFVPDAPQIVLPFTQDVVEHVLDLAQQVKGIQFSDQESTAALGASLEAIMRVFGVSKQHAKNLKSHIPRSQIMQGVQHYQGAMQHIKGVKESAGPGPVAAQQAQGGQPGQPQPDASQQPPQGAGPQPQPPAQPAGGGGGMLSQAAAASGGGDQGSGGESEEAE